MSAPRDRRWSVLTVRDIGNHTDSDNGNENNDIVMAETDDILMDAEDDARCVEYIRNYLPQEVKEKFTDDDLYYFLDVIYDYYANSGIFDAEPDEEGYVDIDLDEVVDYVIKKAKKEDMGDFEHDDVLFVVQGEMGYSESSMN